MGGEASKEKPDGVLGGEERADVDVGAPVIKYKCSPVLAANLLRVREDGPDKEAGLEVLAPDIFSIACARSRSGSGGAR